MTTNEIIKELYGFPNNELDPKTLLNEAVNRLSQFQQLIDDQTNDHYVDTLDFYADRCHKLEEDFTELVMKSGNTCDYCKYNVECKGKECPKYIEGRGCTDENGKYYDWKWNCEDFNFGECPLLEDTPCNGCIGNGSKGFEWRGNNG